MKGVFKFRFTTVGSDSVGSQLVVHDGEPDRGRAEGGGAVVVQDDVGEGRRGREVHDGVGVPPAEGNA